MKKVKKIEYMSILFRPIETKEIWENCAKIIVSQSKEETSRYHYELLHWLKMHNDQDMILFLNILKKYQKQIYIKHMEFV